jgi:hypothetical protein
MSLSQCNAVYGRGALSNGVIVGWCNLSLVGAPTLLAPRCFHHTQVDSRDQ